MAKDLKRLFIYMGNDATDEELPALREEFRRKYSDLPAGSRSYFDYDIAQKGQANSMYNQMVREGLIPGGKIEAGTSYGGGSLSSKSIKRKSNKRRKSTRRKSIKSRKSLKRRKSTRKKLSRRRR